MRITLADHLFRLGHVRLGMNSSRCRAAGRMHCAAADYSAPTSAGAEFSKCHPNGHSRFPVFDPVSRRQTACRCADHYL